LAQAPEINSKISTATGESHPYVGNCSCNETLATSPFTEPSKWAAMTCYQTAKTPDGLVVRKIWPSGECAWRENKDQTVSVCLDHEGPWLTERWDNVPEGVLARFMEAN
jgi:hypothetical protein